MRALVLASFVVLAGCASGEKRERREVFAASEATVAAVAASAEGSAKPAEPAPKAPPSAWAPIATGVFYKDMGSAAGRGIAIVFGGYEAQAPWVEAWAGALHEARLGALGVRHLYAVRGPLDAKYTKRDIGSRALAAHVDKLAEESPWVGVIAHSSGSFVAHELLRIWFGPREGSPKLRGKVHYMNLDGAGAGLTARAVEALESAVFVCAQGVAGESPNADSMKALAAAYPKKSRLIRIATDARTCLPGAKWCLHMRTMTSRPHDARGADLQRDYSDFKGNEVYCGFLDGTSSGG